MQALSFALLAVSLTSISARADIRQWITHSPEVRRAAQIAVQKRFCRQFRSSAKRPDCFRAGRYLNGLLEFSPIPTLEEKQRLADHYGAKLEEFRNFSITALHVDRLTALIERPESVTFLKDLSFYHRYDRSNFNLWDSSVALSPSPFVALERIAVLFQDQSEAREHLQWAISKGVQEESISALTDAHDAFGRELQNNFVDAKISELPLETYYPPEIAHSHKNDLTSGYYHFYAAAYWTARLRKLGISEADAILHVFGVHVAYESKNMPFTGWPFFGPLPQAGLEAFSARDLASAYLGAKFGAALDDGRPASLPNLPKNLGAAFLKDFDATVKSLLAPATKP